MVIERLTDNQIKITISSAVDAYGLQQVIDYVSYLEATANSAATQDAVDELADEVNESWWRQNKSRFIK